MQCPADVYKPSTRPYRGIAELALNPGIPDPEASPGRVCEAELILVGCGLRSKILQVRAV
jgi:hypothetical protein